VAAEIFHHFSVHLLELGHIPAFQLGAYWCHFLRGSYWRECARFPILVLRGGERYREDIFPKE
jgi:hypothetical protein